MNFDHSKFRKSLLNWYQKNKRDLPWRKTKDPYAIWLSEIMLQQTTVETVINGYYPQFLKRFPNFPSIYQANIDDLLHAWSGLGYYNRIRNFKKASIIIEEELNGKIPTQFKELIKLPGLGEYTARALASIAFNEKVAVVDGNVIRVLSRLFLYDEDISSGKAKKFFQEKADLLIDENEPGDFNQAMMELGACICHPKKPNCFNCPVYEFCPAGKTSNPEIFPVKKKKLVYTNHHQLHYIHLYQEKILINQNQSSINHGMWELPYEDLESAAKINPKIENKYKYQLLKTFNHAIMNRRIKIHPVMIEHSKSPNLKEIKNKKWILKSKLDDIALTTVTKKIIKQLNQ